MSQSSVPCSILSVASGPAYRFPRRQVTWSGTPISLIIFHSLLWSTWSKDFLDSSAGKGTTSNTGVSGNMDLIPGSGRFTWRRKWQPIPIENSMDRRVWQAVVYGVTKGQTQLSSHSNAKTKTTDIFDHHNQDKPLESSEQRPGMLLNLLQGTESPWHQKCRGWKAQPQAHRQVDKGYHPFFLNP